jgi:hypothetical protein
VAGAGPQDLSPRLAQESEISLELIVRTTR